MRRWLLQHPKFRWAAVMAATALAIYLTGLALAFGWRSVVQWRRTGDTGLRLDAGPAGTLRWWAKLLFAAALLFAATGPTWCAYTARPTSPTPPEPAGSCPVSAASSARPAQRRARTPVPEPESGGPDRPSRRLHASPRQAEENIVGTDCCGDDRNDDDTTSPRTVWIILGTVAVLGWGGLATFLITR
jgi:hypothetical protein